MTIAIPDFCLVLLIGVSGSGKTTFARRHFRPTEVISSDYCRALIADDENDQSATDDAFALLHFLADKRLKRRRLTVIDATNVTEKARSSLLALAQRHQCPAVALVLDLPETVLNERRRTRTDRDFGDYVLHRQRAALWQTDPRWLDYEGFAQVYRLQSEADVNAVVLSRTRSGA